VSVQLNRGAICNCLRHFSTPLPLSRFTWTSPRHRLRLFLFVSTHTMSNVVHLLSMVTVIAVMLLSVSAAPAVRPRQDRIDEDEIYKRAFDSLTGSGFTGFDKRSFDSLTGSGFTGFDKRAFDSLTGSGFTGFDKRAFDSLTGSGFTGFDKRAFDSLTGSGFTGFD